MFSINEIASASSSFAAISVRKFAVQQLQRRYFLLIGFGSKKRLLLWNTRAVFEGGKKFG